MSTDPTPDPSPSAMTLHEDLHNMLAVMSSTPLVYAPTELAMLMNERDMDVLVLRRDPTPCTRCDENGQVDNDTVDTSGHVIKTEKVTCLPCRGTKIARGPIYIAAAVSNEAPADEQHEREVMEVLKERDDAEGWADRLAYAIAPVDIIGEHSSANNPWLNALNLASPTPADPLEALRAMPEWQALVAVLSDENERKGNEHFAWRPARALVAAVGDRPEQTEADAENQRRRMGMDS